jgi:hypothetical protein
MAADGGVRDGGAQRLGQLGGVREVGAGQQDDELLAAAAVEEVERAQRGAQSVGDVGEDGVPGGMAVRVVDALEVVDVAGDQPNRLGVTSDC